MIKLSLYLKNLPKVSEIIIILSSLYTLSLSSLYLYFYLYFYLNLNLSLNKNNIHIILFFVVPAFVSRWRAYIDARRRRKAAARVCAQR